MSRERCRLLVVEDDTALAALLEEYLIEAGYEVSACHDGDVALDMIGRQRFDLVLSDIMLPGANGLAILKAARGDPSRTLVILMTGFSDVEDAIQAVRQGAYDFVSKPFRLPEILVRLDNAARYQRLLRHHFGSPGEETPLRRVQISGQAAARVYGMP